MVIKMIKNSKIIDFKPFTPNDKALYESYYANGTERTCMYSFANLYAWGKQSFAIIDNQMVMLSQFGNHFVYPFPLGNNINKSILDAVIEDSKARGIPCRFGYMPESAKTMLEQFYPDEFDILYKETSLDYVYDINDLADLKGRKFHSKRNHVHKFHNVFPNYSIVQITNDNIITVRKMLEKWYSEHIDANPDEMFESERRAVDRSLSAFEALELDGIMILNGDDVLAMTLGSRITQSTFDVHYEKALYTSNGTYSAINQKFAQYLRNKYPELKFIDREEDMGDEGLRKAKLSYYPHHMIDVWQASLKD